jgi:hypothetical protein
MNATRSSRHSVTYFPSREGRLPAEGDAFLLARDLQLGIMPIGGHTKRPFAVRLNPADAEGEQWLTTFLHIGQYPPDDLQDAVCDFVETTTNYLAYFGEVYCEILDDPGGEPWQLDTLPPGRVLRTPRRYLQVIPKPDRETFDGRRFASIPTDKAWHLTLPRELGTPRSYRRLLRRLAKLAPHGASFIFGTRDLGAASGYEFSAYLAASQRLQERALRSWGTTTSKFQPVGASTEYFWVARRITFHRSQALVREHTITELNRLLQKLEINHRVIVSGLPTATEISAVLDRLHRGELSFSDALAAVRI